jgi:ribonuclease HI
MESRVLIKKLRTANPDYLDLFWIWVSLHKNGEQGRRIDNVLRELWKQAS